MMNYNKSDKISTQILTDLIQSKFKTQKWKNTSFKKISKNFIKINCKNDEREQR